jgi:hypothetical protein
MVLGLWQIFILLHKEKNYITLRKPVLCHSALAGYVITLHKCTYKTISKLAVAESQMPVHRPASPDVVACIHNGHIYKDGQNFPSNSTGMKVNGPNQCVQCRCQVTADYITKKLISQPFN